MGSKRKLHLNFQIDFLTKIKQLIGNYWFIYLIQDNSVAQAKCYFYGMHNNALKTIRS